MRPAGRGVGQHLVGSAAAIVLVAGAVPASAQTRNFTIQAGPASIALQTFARQAKVQILARAETVRSRRTNAVNGTYSVDEALRLLLKNTGLKATSSDSHIIAIAAEQASPPVEAVVPVVVRERAEPGAIPDILVTARYVDENVQSTPMAISALPRSRLDAANVTTMGTLGAVVPNLWTVPGDARFAGTPMITMRGVRQGDSSSYAASPAVAIYIDDVYHATTAGSDLDFADVDRIEVNRGPQSTLSGNASIGGSIRILTRDPAGDGSGYMSLGAGSRRKFVVNSAVDLGLSSTLAVRLSGYFQRQDGFVDRLDFTCQMMKQGTPQLAGTFPLDRPDSARRDCVIGKLGGGAKGIGRAKLRWRPDDKLDLVLTASKRIEDMEETPELALAYQPNPDPNPNMVVQTYNKAVEDTFGIRLDDRFLAPPARPYSTYATNCRPLLPLGDPYPPAGGGYVPSGFCFPTNKTAHYTLVSGRLHYDLAEHVALTAIAAHTAYDNEFTTAGDQSPLGYTISHFANRAHQNSGELRVDGTGFGDRLEWIAGGFWLRLTGYQDSFIGFNAQASFVHDRARIESQSGFFHVDYSITDAWRVSGGARYTDGRIAYHFDHPPLLTIADPFVSSEGRWDWLLSSDYRIADGILIYASAATGSRPPGAVTVINTAQQFLPTPGEDLIAYEAGVKADLFDRRLRMNLSAFYTDYRSLSTSAVGVQCLGQKGPATWFPTRNDCLAFADASFLGWNLPVGVGATITGFEWEVAAMPVNGLRLDWSGGHNHYRSDVKTPGAPGYLWPGNHRQPSWNMHASVAYDVDTPIGVFAPLIDWTWQSQQDFDTTSSVRPPLPIFIVRPYSIWNAQIGYRTSDRSWSATLTVANLTDRKYSYLKLNGTLNAQSRAAPPREFTPDPPAGLLSPLRASRLPGVRRARR